MLSIPNLESRDYSPEVILADPTPGAIYRKRNPAIHQGTPPSKFDIFLRRSLDDEFRLKFEPVEIERKAGLVLIRFEIPVSDNQAIDWIKFSLDDFPFAAWIAAPIHQVASLSIYVA